MSLYMMDFSDFLEHTPTWQYRWLFSQKREVHYILTQWRASDFIKEVELERILRAMAGSVSKGRKSREITLSEAGNKEASVRWLSLDLRSQAMQARVIEYSKDVDGVLDHFVCSVDAGLDVSFKRDSRGKLVAYGFFPLSKGASVRNAVSANGKDAWSALVALMFKCNVLLSELGDEAYQEDEYQFS